MSHVKKSKRLMLLYIVILLWLGMGIFGLVYAVSFFSLAAYFLSLTGFIASYMWGESVRPAMSTSVFKSGGNSTREVIIYFTILIWAGMGIYGILKSISLEELGAYYSALTPFVASYIIGVSYKPTHEYRFGPGDYRPGRNGASPGKPDDKPANENGAYAAPDPVKNSNSTEEGV